MDSLVNFDSSLKKKKKHIHTRMHTNARDLQLRRSDLSNTFVTTQRPEPDHDRAVSFQKW